MKMVNGAKYDPHPGGVFRRHLVQAHHHSSKGDDVVTQDMEKTLRLIKHLLAHADSAAQIGSSEEAATFAAKANELLLKHKLEMTDLERVTEDQDDPIKEIYINVAVEAGLKKGGGQRRRAYWIENLAFALANGHFCRAVPVWRSKKIFIVGRTSDLAIVSYLLTTLAREAERLAQLYERKARVGAQRAGLPIPRTPKRDFLMGFGDGIREKIKSMRETIIKQAGGFALVRFQQADAAITAYYQQKVQPTLNRGSSGPSSHSNNLSARAAGKEAGKKQSLHGGLGAAKGGNGGTLAKGTNLLGGGK
jgi:hypothetical protein